MGYSFNWIRLLARRYNQLGPDILTDQQQDNLGGEPLLSDVQQAQLWQALQGPAPDGGLWGGPKVAAWVSLQKMREIQNFWVKLSVQAGTSNILAMECSWACTSPLLTSITCPFLSMFIVSYPFSVRLAELKDLNPNPGLISRCRKR